MIDDISYPDARIFFYLGEGEQTEEIDDINYDSFASIRPSADNFSFRVEFGFEQEN